MAGSASGDLEDDVLENLRIGRRGRTARLEYRPCHVSKSRKSRRLMASPADLFRRAVSSFQQGRIGEAEHSLKQLLRKEPRHLAALNILAIVLTMSGKYADAERHLQSALKINSTSDATFYNYGIVLKALGRPDEALLRFGQAIAINPGNAETWNNRGT